MQLSVAMATWQGDRYLHGQLSSLLGQTRLPDELIVVDDASDDATVDMLEEFAGSAPFKVHVLESDFRRGSTEAFARAIAAASGDVIALSDQDDLWMPQKLARLESVFLDRPDTTFAFTDAQLMDDNDILQRTTMWETRKFSPSLRARVRRRPFAELSHRWLATGCTIAFRADLRSVLLPFPTELSDLFAPMIHDRWLSLILSAVGPVAVVNEPLVAYRLHASQQIGMANVAAVKPPLSRYLNKITTRRSDVRSIRLYHLAHLQEVKARAEHSTLAGEEALSEIEGAIAHLRLRLDQPDHRYERLTPVLNELATGGYHHFSRGWSSAAVDLLKV